MSDETKNPLDGELSNDADITETHTEETHSEKTTSDGDTETKVTSDDVKANVPDTDGLAVDGGGPLP